MLQTSRGGHDTAKIVDSIQDRDINQVSAPICCLSWLTFRSIITNIRNLWDTVFCRLHLFTEMSCMS